MNRAAKSHRKSTNRAANNHGREEKQADGKKRVDRVANSHRQCVNSHRKRANRAANSHRQRVNNQTGKKTNIAGDLFIKTSSAVLF